MHREKLFCITKYCCAPCKIVLYHEKSLCIQLNIELCFALVGHRSFEGGKTLFSSIAGLAEEKNEHFVPKKSNYVS